MVKGSIVTAKTAKKANATMLLNKALIHESSLLYFKLTEPFQGSGASVSQAVEG
jgi:hypothetical protein